MLELQQLSVPGVSIVESRDAHEDDDENVRNEETDNGGIACVHRVLVLGMLVRRFGLEPGGKVYATVGSGKAARAIIWESSVTLMGLGGM